MQVNQSTSPNFGQLKIIKTPELIKGLKNEKIEVLNKVKEAGEKLKDTKFYNIIIRHDATITDIPAIHLESPIKAYFGVFASEYYKKIVFNKDNNVLAIDNTYGISRFPSETAGRAEYTVWGGYEMFYDTLNDIDILTRIALELDKAAVTKCNKKVAAKAAEAAYQKEVDTSIDDLLANFGE